MNEKESNRDLYCSFLPKVQQETMDNFLCSPKTDSLLGCDLIYSSPSSPFPSMLSERTLHSPTHSHATVENQKLFDDYFDLDSFTYDKNTKSIFSVSHKLNQDFTIIYCFIFIALCIYAHEHRKPSLESINV